MDLKQGKLVQTLNTNYRIYSLVELSSSGYLVSGAAEDPPSPIQFWEYKSGIYRLKQTLK